jgi:hypothetical protein
MLSLDNYVLIHILRSFQMSSVPNINGTYYSDLCETVGRGIQIGRGGVQSA